MGIFDQFKMAQEMMKNMSPEQIQELMKQAKDSQSMLSEQIKKAVEEEIRSQDLISRDELDRILKSRGL